MTCVILKKDTGDTPYVFRLSIRAQLPLLAEILKTNGMHCRTKNMGVTLQIQRAAIRGRTASIMWTELVVGDANSAAIRY